MRVDVMGEAGWRLYSLAAQENHMNTSQPMG